MVPVSSDRVQARSGSLGWELHFLFKREDGFYLHQPWEAEPSLHISGSEITEIIDCETVDPARKGTCLKIKVSQPSKVYKGHLFKAFKVDS